MRTIELGKEALDLDAIIKLASKEPVLLLTREGKEFCLAEADDFEREVGALRGSQAFQRFSLRNGQPAGREFHWRK